MPSIRPCHIPLISTLVLAACGAEPTPPAPIPPPAAIAAPVAEPVPVEPVAQIAEAQPEAEQIVAPERELISEKWYASFQDGQRSGWLHVVWTASEHAGRPTIHDRTERSATQTRRMGRVEDVFEWSSVSDLERTEDGRLLHLRSVTREPGRETVVEQRWTGSGYERTATAAGASEAWTLECEEPLPVDGEAFLATRVQSGAVNVGDTFTYPVANFDAARLETVELQVTGREMLTLATGTVDCLRVKETVRGIPGVTELWLDGEGVVRRYEASSTRLEHTTERRARDVPVGGVSYSITLNAEPHLPRATSFDESVVEVVFDPDDDAELPDIPSTPFAEVIAEENRTLTVRLTSHDDPDATVALPVRDDSMERWLRPTLLECSDHPSVRAELRAAIGDETDGRTVATLLLRHVFDILEKGSGPVAAPNAAEILRDGGGDCSEHAVLFVALCRAAGLPARRHSGYALVGDSWGSHAFCEVWLGEWVGADPTTNELGTRARYIGFGGNDDPDAFPGIVSQRMRACTAIRNVSFREGAESFVVADLEPTNRHDPFADLTLADPPEGWRLRMGSTPGYASARGHGSRFSVRVSSGMGHTPADLVANQFFQSPDAVTTFAGREVALIRWTNDERRVLMIGVPHRRRLLMIDVALGADTDEDEVLEAIETILAPTLSDN